jgi:hypothetical protein
MTDHRRKEFHVYTGNSADQEVLEALRHQAFYSEPAPTPVVDTPLPVPTDADAQGLFLRGLGINQPEFAVSLGVELGDIERGMQA